MSYVDDDDDQKALVQQDSQPLGVTGLVIALAFLPVRLFLVALSNASRLALPITPKLIPFVVCSFFIPLVLFVSISAGWIVWRNVAVGWEATLYLQYGDGIPPYAEVALPMLAAQQRYDISLHLVIPATETNYALGNFMTTLRLTTAANDTLTTVRRPAIVILPRTKRWSGSPDVVEFDVPLLDSYVTRASNVFAKVELGRRDGWKSIGNGEGREISVLSSSLRGTIRHHGIRGLVTRFPLLAAIVSTGVFFGISFIILAACILPTVHRQPRDDGTPQTSPVKSEAEGRALLESPDEDSVQKWRRRSRGSRSRSEEGTSFKAEPASLPIPTADSKRTPVRRRRSKGFDRDRM